MAKTNMILSAFLGILLIDTSSLTVSKFKWTKSAREMVANLFLDKPETFHQRLHEESMISLALGSL